MSKDIEITQEMADNYCAMAQDFLPRIFDLRTMGHMFYGYLDAGGMNAEQASSRLERDVCRNIKRVSKLNGLDDHEAVGLINAIAVLVHIRRCQLQTVGPLDKVPQELQDKIEALAKQDIPLADLHAQVRALRKEYGL